MRDQLRLTEARGDRRGGVADMDHEGAAGNHPEFLRPFLVNHGHAVKQSGEGSTCIAVLD
jgi:hypothetical protein